jgi:GAF domain-containing protein
VLAGQRVPLGEGLAGLAAVTHEVQIGSPTYAGVVQAQRGETPPGQPTSLIAAPVLARDELVGVITAVTFAPGRRFSAQDALLYARAAAVAGRLIDASRRLERLEATRTPAEARLFAAVERLRCVDGEGLEEVAALVERLALAAGARA